MNALEHAGLLAINSVEFPGSMRSRQALFCKEHQLTLDIYDGGASADGLVTLFFYGGNWQSGHRSQYRFVGEALARLGVTAVVADYRKWPAARFADTYQDANEALDWVMTEYPGREIVLAGHSAGAHLAGLLAINRSLGGGSPIKGLIGLAGPYYFYPFSESMHWHYFGPAWQYPLSQPVWQLHQDVPSMLLLHGANDHRVRRGQSKALYERVLGLGGLAIRRVYENLGHAELILECVRWRRPHSFVIEDIARYLNALTTHSVAEMERELWR